MNRAVFAGLGGRTFAAFKVRNFRLFISGQVVSMTGTWVQMVAHVWLVLELTGSGTALGLVVAAQFLPTLLLGPFGGVLADRFDTRRLLMLTQTAAGSVALTLGVLTVTGVIRLWMVFVLALLAGLVTAADNPSRQTFVSQIVGPANVANAVTLNAVVMNGARVAGPAVAAVAIATVGVGWCFIVNAASFLPVIVALLFMRTSELVPAERAPRRKGQVREGLRYVRSEPQLYIPLVMMAVVGTFTYEFMVTLPLLSEFEFGTGSSGYAAMSALMGVGAVLGGLVAASLGSPTLSRVSGIAIGFGVLTFAIAFTPNLPVALLLMPFVGAASVTYMTMTNAILQLSAAPALRGRVMALFSIALIGSTPIGGPIVGVISEHAGSRVALSIGGVAAVGIGVYGRRGAVRMVPAAAPEPALSLSAAGNAHGTGRP